MPVKCFLKEPLFEPLLDRAVASAYLPGFGFIDRAAETLIENLGIAASHRQRALRRLKHDSRSILRCQWIDEQLQSFFAEHPEGTAVEVGAGLSTRFHRLSYSGDWPKFSWLSVDSNSVIDSVSHCFPSVDNFSYYASGLGNTRWLRTLKQSNRAPYFIVIESYEYSEDLLTLLRICQAMHNELGHLHIIVDLGEDKLKPITRGLDQKVSVRASLCLCSAKKSFLNYFTRMRSYSSINKHKVCHLVVGEEPRI